MALAQRMLLVAVHCLDNCPGRSFFFVTDEAMNRDSNLKATDRLRRNQAN
jgi:hypothetical protein